MTNSTSADVNFESAWCNRVVANQEDSYSAAPADKQINKKISQPTPPRQIIDSNYKISILKFVGKY